MRYKQAYDGDWFDLILSVKWSEPLNYDDKQGIFEFDKNAYFYSIVGFTNNSWVPYYFGITNKQSVSVRIHQEDHRKRRLRLKENHPDIDFMISLGVPSFSRGKINNSNIELIEGLFIYSHCHDDLVNQNKYDRFATGHHIHVTNTGWNKHAFNVVSHGVFVDDGTFS